MTINISLESLFHEFLLACGCKKNKQVAQSVPKPINAPVTSGSKEKEKA
jgi:hypothetical protein